MRSQPICLATPIIEEVIVTATYRETRLMDTPQAVSAVTDDLVEDLGAQSMEDIYTMVPSLSMCLSYVMNRMSNSLLGDPRAKSRQAMWAAPHTTVWTRRLPDWRGSLGGGHGTWRHPRRAAGAAATLRGRLRR